MDRVKLENICHIQSGGTPSRKNSSFYEGNIFWAKISDLEKAGDGFIYETEESISKDGLSDIRNRIFDEGTLFLAMYGSVGKTAISKTKMSCNQAILGINPKKDNKIDLNYLKYWFDLNREKLRNSARGVALKNISATIVRSLEVPLPNLQTQKRIASILDDAQALKQKTEKLLAEYDELAQSIFLDMFGNPATNPKNWDNGTCGEFIDYLADIGSNGANKVVSANLVMSDEEDYAIMIRTTNFTKNDFNSNLKYVSKEVYEFFKKTKVFGGEIIMNKIGSAGDFWLMPKLSKPVSLGLNQFMIRLNDKMDMNFFYYFLSTDYSRINIKSKVNGVATKSITKTAVRELPIYYPPIELQREFSNSIVLIEQQKELAKQELKESEDLFNCLLQKAFKGELN